MQRLFIVIWLMSVMLFSVASAGIMSMEDEIAMVSGTLSLPKGSYVIYNINTDINNDGDEESVFVFGKKNNENDKVTKDINIAVFNKQGILHKTNTNGVSGSGEVVITEDFNGDKIKDIAVILDSGESKTCFVGDFSHSIPKNIMTAKNLKGLEAKLILSKDYKITSQLENNQLFGINLEKIKDKLTENGIYDSDGNVIFGTPAISPVTDIKVVQSKEGYYNFKFVQNIYIKETNLVICIVESEMEYTNDTLLIKEIEYYTS